MEQTEFQQMMAELKEKNERKRFEQLSQKYATAPDFSNMSLRDELSARIDLDELGQLKQKFSRMNDQNQTPINGQTITPLGRVQQASRYIDNTPKPISVADIALEGLKGFCEGIENGTLTALNASTGGLYGLADYFYLGSDYANKRQQLQQRAEDVGLGGANMLANYAIETGMSGISAKKSTPYVLKKIKSWL